MKFPYPLALLAAAAAAVAASCQKEISMDYRSITPLYVVEGTISNEGADVFIGQTRDMTDSVRSRGVGGAVVTITSLPDGSVTPLHFQPDGHYRPDTTLAGTAGTTYRLDVAVAGQTFSAESTMPPAAQIYDARFVWEDVLIVDVLTFEVKAEELPGDASYYLYRMSRNGEEYAWGVRDNRGVADTLLIDIACMTEKIIDHPDTKEYEDFILADGDRVDFELLTIDRPVYDYFTSLRASDRTGSNPISQFAGSQPCLGYFSAHSVTRIPAISFVTTRP